MADNEKKKEIRRRAAALFREKGYDNVTVNEIAAASGISKNTFYYYYENKEELIRSMFDPQTFDMDRLMVELLSYSDPYEQILCLMRLTAEYFESLGKEIVRKAMVMNLSRAILVRPEKDCGRQEQNHPVLAVFERAVREKRVRTDVTGRQLMGTCAVILLGCLQIWATTELDRPLAVIVREQVTLVLACPA